jgi:hypothetical protein
MLQPLPPAGTTLALRVLWACFGLTVVEFGALALDLVQTSTSEDARFLLTGLVIIAVAFGMVYGTLLVKVCRGKNWARVALAVWSLGWLAVQAYAWIDVGPTGWPLCVSNYGIPLLELFAVALLFRGDASSWFRPQGSSGSAL